MQKSRSMIITSTSLLDGYETQKYLGLVSAHVVAGTNIFSDIVASFSDVFGGPSESYQGQLAWINDEVLRKVKESAAELGANAIIGLRIDHDEISGKGKGMLMVTASGTAVVVQQANQSKDSTKGPSIVFSDELNEILHRKALKKKAESGSLAFNKETWNFLCSTSVPELAETILNTIANPETQHLTELPNDFLPRAKSYFRRLDIEDAKRELYGAQTSPSRAVKKFALDVISDRKLLDFDEVEKLLRTDDLQTQKAALALLMLDKSFYSENDLSKIAFIIELAKEKFPKVGEVIEAKHLLSSKPKQVWKCPCGKTNSADAARCVGCQNDIYGFALHSDDDLQTVLSLLSQKVSTLKEIFDVGMR